MLISAFVPGCSYATTGSVSISSPTYIIPVSGINALLGSASIGTGDSAERLLYGLIQALYVKQQAASINQTNLGVEVSNKSLSRNIWESSVNVFSDVTLANFLVSCNMGATSVAEDPSNLVVQ